MKENGRKKMYHANSKLAKAGVAIISTKVYFKTKTIPRDKDRYFIIINGSIHQEDTTVIIITELQSIRKKNRQN